jgi:hypothetical protein
LVSAPGERSICGGRRPLSKIYVAHQTRAGLTGVAGRSTMKSGRHCRVSKPLSSLRPYAVCFFLRCREWLPEFAVPRPAARGGAASPQGSRSPLLRSPALHGANVPHAFRAVAPPPPKAHKRALRSAFAFANSSTAPHILPGIAVQPNLCLLPLQNTRRPPRAAARRQHMAVGWANRSLSNRW